MCQRSQAWQQGQGLLHPVPSTPMEPGATADPSSLQGTRLTSFANTGSWSSKTLAGVCHPLPRCNGEMATFGAGITLTPPTYLEHQLGHEPFRASSIASACVSGSFCSLLGAGTGLAAQQQFPLTFFSVENKINSIPTLPERQLPAECMQPDTMLTSPRSQETAVQGEAGSPNPGHGSCLGA